MTPEEIQTEDFKKANEEVEKILGATKPKHLGQGLTSGIGYILRGAVGACGAVVVSCVWNLLTITTQKVDVIVSFVPCSSCFWSNSYYSIHPSHQADCSCLLQYFSSIFLKTVDACRGGRRG